MGLLQDGVEFTVYQTTDGVQSANTPLLGGRSQPGAK